MCFFVSWWLFTSNWYTGIYYHIRCSIRVNIIYKLLIDSYILLLCGTIEQQKRCAEPYA
ncbi:hypothetical protein HanRHA438_Chr01g0023511 [Helianthus annuus]|uniref:Uncharacterized protein n=1 Tax=Helianthus annuus TaxID=4232 RepID=A0A251VPZ6_HELAN|nr:hypothetical protein HanXRQr2_Chr01g0022881 [Helianthus annuus]KAJ0948110.1 hypothetical protein HanRHA438_Chr01g0023511 [Helianthus annuus]KAJ0956999.1 hypothetical protein HanPSC8_Chr01g0022121 [Helianthus annuus]